MAVPPVDVIDFDDSVDCGLVTADDGDSRAVDRKGTKPSRRRRGTRRDHSHLPARSSYRSINYSIHSAS